VAKAFYTSWVDGRLDKLTTLNFPSYLLKTMFTYLNSWTFEASFQTDTTICSRMRAVVDQGGIILPVMFSLNDMPSPSVCVEFPFYADDTIVTATSISQRCL
jgi:hypothetical protein